MTSSPTESADTFQFGFVLHNLTLPDGRRFSLEPEAGYLRLPGVEEFEIVPSSDPRLDRLEHADRVRELLAAFRSLGGHPYKPAVLLVPRAPTFSNEEGFRRLFDWRNAVAIARVLPARAEAIRADNAVHPYWSDVFEVHPIGLSGSGGFVSNGQGALSLISRDVKLHLTHSPHLSPNGIYMHCDRYLERALGEAYAVAHGDTAREWGATVFRSLELAMSAASLRAVNAASLVDVGTTINLWVSALEVLAWPARRRADKEAVHELLGGYFWQSDRLASPEHFCFMTGRDEDKQAVTGNVCQFLSAALYRARNDFTHGNPISLDTLRAKGTGFTASLLDAAPIVYRTALVAYLSSRVPIAMPGEDEWMHDPHFFNELLTAHLTYDTALERALGAGDERD